MTISVLAPPPSHPALTFASERPEDARLADGLIDRAFGPGRFAKTAERLREGNRLRPDLSVCAWDGDQLAGVVRLWPVLIGGTPAVFLGPFAVDAPWRSRKLGRALIERAVARCEAAGERVILLVGAKAYFEPLGFLQVPMGRLSLPGPVDPARLLWRSLGEGATEGLQGAVRVPPRVAG
jgi:predicted N-acetyltransferase YhbS